jgi:phospholipase C
MARVYNAIRANEALWESTLLVLTYDEHGGFFDHVEPPSAVCPDGFRAEYSFEQLGVRVPALLVSPWVEAGVWSQQLDHTSVGKYVCDKWRLPPLGRRMAEANSLAGAIQPALRRNTPE